MAADRRAGARLAAELLHERVEEESSFIETVRHLVFATDAWVNREPGYPEPESFPVRRCLLAVVNEEWQHRLYVERDFDVLERRSGE